MEDRKIIELFFERSEKALDETEKKYGRYCHTVAYSVLGSKEDSEEVVNDTYLRAWNAIPPARPLRLGAFLAKIARNLALDRYAAKRKERENLATEAVLDELADCLPDTEGLSVTDELVLRGAIDSFLESLPEQTRTVFMRRYWYMMPIARVAYESGMTESNVKTTLHRTRLQFKEHLEKEGIVI